MNYEITEIKVHITDLGIIPNLTYLFSKDKVYITETDDKIEIHLKEVDFEKIKELIISLQNYVDTFERKTK